MTRKKTRRTRSFSQAQDLQLQNPNTRMAEEDQSQSLQSLSQSQDSFHHENQQQQDLQQQQEDEEQEDAESQGTAISPSHPLPSAHDSNPPSLARKGGKRKKPISRKRRDAAQKKLRLLKQNLQPIPFTPIKTLDLSKHENLFKTLGLWDFAHLELDQDIRSDLLSFLIANYDSAARRSYVKDQRINVNRADLGRALKLPVKKDKTALSEFPDSDHEGFSEESIAAVDEFMSTYILLHGDTWMMPDEILTSERHLKDGQLQKIDWAGLIWFMVEKELSQAPESGSCYYASHLQYLMKSQKPDLFKEVDVEEVSLEEDGDGDADVTRTESLDAFQEHENPRIELSLGQEKSESEHAVEVDNAMNFQECKEPEQWFLRDCSLNVLGDSECERVDKEAEEERYSPGLKFPKLERLQSAVLIQDMETTNASYDLPVNLIDPSAGEFLTPRGADMHKNISLNTGGLSMFADACKREVNDEDMVRDISHNDHHGKMKNDGLWDDTPEGFVMCMEQAQSWLSKARAMHEEKEEAYAGVRMHLEYLATEVQKRDNVIHSLQKNVLEERNKKQVEIYRLERELCVMTQLLHGYKKALKETHTAFAQYRERCQLPDEPMYKDVGGNGGGVLSIMELEKQRLEKEEEERKMWFAIKEKIKSFEQEWLGSFNSHLDQVDLFDKRLLQIVKEAGFLKENSKTEPLAS